MSLVEDLTVIPGVHPQRLRPAELPDDVIATLLAVAGVRSAAVVLDLTPASSLVRAAAAASGRSGVVLTASPAALGEALPATLRGAAVTHAFASLPGGRLLTALRPVLRPAARVAVTGVDGDAIREAAVIAAYDVVHLEVNVCGLAVAGLRPRPPS